MTDALRRHWPEYLMEAALLGLFMLSASLFATLLYHPASPLGRAPIDPLLRRLGMGLAMGLTAVALIYSPWGRRSGAHFNPAVTLAFFRLGRVAPWDALFYGAAHVVGGVAGVAIVAIASPGLVGHPSVNFVVTVPGPVGAGAAFAAELAISLALMTVVLTTSNHPRLAPFTGLCAGALVAAYITLEAPLSGMSMNPARTFASALPAHVWTAFWVYLIAPPLGMLLAAEIHGRLRGRPTRCAKLYHDSQSRCIFRCDWATSST